MDARYLGRRLAQALVTIAAILVLAFAAVHLAPGDPVLALGGEHGDAAYYALIREKFGLDRPLLEQFGSYATHVLRGDLGVSFVHGRPVVAVIAERLPATLLLMLTALAVSTTVGSVLGLVAALRARHASDLALRAAAIVGYATPSFWLAQLAVLALAVGAGLFPVHGMTDARLPAAGVAHVLDVLHHLALPATVLAANELALTTRLVRAGLVGALREDYVRTARAKGLRETAVLRHAGWNVLLPVVTVLGARAGMVCSGAVLVESVFAWPGAGRLLLESVQARDYPLVLGMFVLVSVTVAAANLATDLVYGFLDPRVRQAC